MSSIIPHFHFVNPLKKTTPEWCMEAVNYYWFNTSHKGLLDGKNIKQIEDYAKGDFDMKPFMRMYKSIAKKLTEQITSTNADVLINNDANGIDFMPLPLIPAKLNSAISLTQKIPIEVTCKANDSLAMKKKQEDIDFLLNKPALEQDLQEFADKLRIGKVDLGTTKNSDIDFSDNPFGLDLQDPEQRKIFSLLYSLRVETAFEKVLQQFYDLKRMQQVRLLEIKDQYNFGVSAHAAYTSSITGLPDAEYVFPGEIETEESSLHDMSDNTVRFRHKRMTPLEMFNMFGSEIRDEDELEEIVNGKKTGYCDCNSRNKVSSKDFGSFKLDFVMCEVKSIDWVGMYEKPKSKRGVVELTMDEAKATDKIWGQNTYQFWWLKNTDQVYGIKKLDFSHRTRGLESYQNFSTNIYRSQKRSAVELSIGENKKAQIAEIKMLHAIAVSLPPGRVIDVKGIRNAAEGMDDENNPITKQSLIDLALEKNIIIIDSEGFEGKNDGQLKPFYEIPGGIRTEVSGYMQVILQCASNISRFTGISENLSGERSEDLIGLQKLRINASVNSLHYVAEAIETQYQSLMNNWANLVQYAIEKGGKTKEAIVNYIGLDDVNILDGLNEIPLHNLTIKVSLTQREEERENYRQKLTFLLSQGIISTADEFLLSAITNPKERMRFLVTKENIFKKEQQKQKELDREAMMQRTQAQNEGILAAQNAKTEGAVKQIYSKGEVDAKLLALTAKLGIDAKEIDFIGNKALQQDRGQDQLNKAERVIEKKQETELQQPLPFV
jgi:hypothetical protein